jgi:hypothetical protein
MSEYAAAAPPSATTRYSTKFPRHRAREFRSFNQLSSFHRELLQQETTS